MPDFNVASYRGDGQVLKAERQAGKRESAKLNPVIKNNQFIGLDFPDYEYEPWPKMIPVPMPMVGALPDEDEMPIALKRKVREWEDDHGQIHQWRESDKAWLRRCERAWPQFYPIAQNQAEADRIKKEWGAVTPAKVQAGDKS